MTITVAIAFLLGSFISAAAAASYHHNRVFVLKTDALQANRAQHEDSYVNGYLRRMRDEMLRNEQEFDITVKEALSIVE